MYNMILALQCMHTHKHAGGDLSPRGKLGLMHASRREVVRGRWNPESITANICVELQTKAKQLQNFYFVQEEELSRDAQFQRAKQDLLYLPHLQAPTVRTREGT